MTPFTQNIAHAPENNSAPLTHSPLQSTQQCGQALVMACAVMFTNVFEVSRNPSVENPHLFSLTLIMPFIAVCIGLLRHNWYASILIVGFIFLCGRWLASRRAKKGENLKTVVITSPPPPQVPSRCLRRRHVLLLCRHDVCRGGNSGPLLKDASPIPGERGPKICSPR